MPPITLRGSTIDPENPPEGLLPPDASDTNFILVQAAHALNRQESLQLNALGVEIQQLQDHNYTYLCRYKPSDLARIEALPFVKHAITYHPSFVIDDNLTNIDIDNPPTYVKVVGQDGEKKGETLYDVNILLHQDTVEHGDDVFRELQQRAGEGASLRKIASDKDHLRVQLPIRLLEAAAAIDHVVAIYSATETVSQTAESRKILQIDPALFTNTPWYSSYQWLVGYRPPWTGRGQTIAIADTGMSDGFGAGAVPHPAFEGRIANTQEFQHIEGEAQNLKDEDNDSHGTHVAGCAVGWDWHLASSERWNPVSQTYWKSCQMFGTAPEAHLYVQKWKKLGDASYSFANLAADVRQNCRPVRIYSNSYGSRFDNNRQCSYFSDTKATDIDKFTYANEEFLVVFAAGNDGTLTAEDPNINRRSSATPFNMFNRQIGGPASAKNALTVGATYNGRDYAPYENFVLPHAPPPSFQDLETYDGDPIGSANDTYSLPPSYTNPDPPNGPPVVRQRCGREIPGTICTFSNKGPTARLYLKPEVVAPGAGILSAFSLNATAQQAKKGMRNSNDGTFQANYCIFPDMQFASGTSMAAPQVAGIAACIREAALTRQVDLVGSTLRAIIVNTAISLQGQDFFYLAQHNPGPGWRAVRGQLGAPPDCIQGYGQVSYRRCMIPVINSPRLVPDPVKGYGWTGFHQVLSRNGGEGALTNTHDVWPDNLINVPARMASYIDWTSSHRQLKVTMAYNDTSGAILQHDLKLSVQAQGVSADGTTVRVIQENQADAPGIYPAMDAWAPLVERTPLLGTVNRVTWVNIVDTNLLNPGERLRFQMRVRAVRILNAANLPGPRVGFSLCWVCWGDDNF